MINHTRNKMLDDLDESIEYIISPAQHITPSSGVIGDRGTLNGRGLFGSIFLNIIIAPQTIMNDANVP